MKIFRYFMALLAGLVIMSCQKEEGNPPFGPDEVYIYENVAESYTVGIGDEFTLDMTVSPNDGSVECRWLLDGIVISASKSLVYVFVEPGNYQLVFEATRGQRTVKKYFQITVTE